MGRKSKLTEKQWAQIGARFYAGESARLIARDYPITEAAIRQRFTTQSVEIKNVANQIVGAEIALKKLPQTSQIAVIDLAAKLRSISEHLGCAANYGAMTTHRMAAIAHAQIEKVDDADPMSSEDALKSIVALTKISNDASILPMALLNANKDMMNNGGGSNSSDVLRELVANLPS